MFKMYNKMKPIKWGVKIYSISESLTGYLLTVLPYFGKYTLANDTFNSSPVTERTILKLVDTLKEVCDTEGMHIFMDRYYSGATLYEELLKRNVYATGTIMLNRKNLPFQIKKMSLNEDESIFFKSNNGIELILWKDKKVIAVLSSYYTNEIVTIFKKKKNNILKKSQNHLLLISI